MHNPQHAGTIFRNCLIGLCAVGVARIGLDPIRRAERRLDPVDGDISYADRFMCVLGEADHSTFAAMCQDLRIEEPTAQRLEAFECALLGIRGGAPITTTYLDLPLRNIGTGVKGTERMP